MFHSEEEGCLVITDSSKSRLCHVLADATGFVGMVGVCVWGGGGGGSTVLFDNLTKNHIFEDPSHLKNPTKFTNSIKQTR